MKRRYLLFIILIVIIFVVNVKSKELKITLKKVRNIGSCEKGELYRWIDLTFDENDNIYVTDMLDYSIKKYDFNGNFIKKVGRKGSGPGEFYSPGLIAYSNGKIYVTQQMFPGIQVFDKDLNFKYKIKTNIPIMSFRTSPEGKLYLLSPGISENDIMKINNPENKHLRINVKYKSFSFLNLGVFNIDKNNNLIRIYFGKNKIIKYDSSGKKLWVKSIPFLKKEGAKLKIRNHSVSMFKEYILIDIAIDTEGLIYVLGGDYSGKKEVYILNHKGDYLTKVKLAESSHRIVIRYNFLFSRGKGGEAINVYKIIKNK